MPTVFLLFCELFGHYFTLCSGSVSWRMWWWLLKFVFVCCLRRLFLACTTTQLSSYCLRSSATWSLTAFSPSMRQVHVCVFFLRIAVSFVETSHDYDSTEDMRRSVLHCSLIFLYYSVRQPCWWSRVLFLSWLSVCVTLARTARVGPGTMRTGLAEFPGRRSYEAYQTRVLFVLLAWPVFSVSLLCLGCMWCFVSLFLVVHTSAINCVERLVSKMTCCMSSGTLNPTHSLTKT